MGYLICEECEGYYQLQEKEFPDDFTSCECGGKLIFVENLIDYYGESLDESLIKKDGLKSESKTGIRRTSGLINLKALFLGGVLWVVLDSLLYGVSIYNIDGITFFSLLFAQLSSGLLVGYLSGNKYKAGILNGFIIGIFFAIILILGTNPPLILMALLGSSILPAIAGGIIGVFINRKLKKEKNTELTPHLYLEGKKVDWSRNLAVWLGGLGVLFLFLYFPVFGGILILFAFLIYISRNFLTIYAFIGVYMGYTIIQMIWGVYDLVYAYMSIYEREDMYSFIALTIFNLVICGYILYKTRKFDKKN